MIDRDILVESAASAAPFGLYVLLAVVVRLCAGQSAGNAAVVYGQLGSLSTLDVNSPINLARCRFSQLTRVARPGPNSSPTASGLNGPSCVRTDLVGNVYVCDAGNNRVVMFDAAEFNARHGCGAGQA